MTTLPSVLSARRTWTDSSSIGSQAESRLGVFRTGQKSACDTTRNPLMSVTGTILNRSTMPTFFLDSISIGYWLANRGSTDDLSEKNLGSR